MTSNFPKLNLNRIQWITRVFTSQTVVYVFLFLLILLPYQRFPPNGSYISLLFCSPPDRRLSLERKFPFTASSSSSSSAGSLRNSPRMEGLRVLPLPVVTVLFGYRVTNKTP
ncbi:unnamed protein product [Lactuca virosa]|uniref:Transmembrane protein n=1 Tax=Lactuca virosa TaxID=75947 RepID=A0AAU9NZ29_9ASTR|nr:unnamed protein product [Lactuca virosa]